MYAATQASFDRPSGTPAHTSRFYRPELDVIRFVAFISVFLHHTFPSRTPFLQVLQESFGFGMCLFFFLSSYLITELLLRERSQTGTVHVPSFYARRMLRIWPLYFGFLIFGVVFGKIVPATSLSPGLIASFVFLAGNWYVAVNGFPNSPVGLLWSISLEEQFYLTWPFFIKYSSPKTLLIACSLLIALSEAIACTLLALGATPPVQIWVNSFVQLQFFAMGALLAIGLRGKIPALSTLTRLIMLGGAAITWFSAEALFHINSYGIRPTSAGLIAGYLFVGIACALLVASSLGFSDRWIPKPLTYLGKISYGLYVFHGLPLGIVHRWLESNHIYSPALSDGISLLLTIAMAALSYRFFESPFLKLKRRFTFVQSRAV